MNTKFVNIDNISIPDCMFFPYKTGDKALDLVFSELGGVIPSQVTLLTAKPGVGKTTLACKIGSGITEYIKSTEDPWYFNDESYRPNGPVILISREMSDFQIKLLSKKITNFSQNILLTTEKGNYLEWIEDLYDLNPSVVIIDSVQQIAYEMGGSKNLNQIEIIDAFNDFAKATFSSVILIGHVSKEGNYIGPSYLKHKVDSHLVITQEKDSINKNIQMEKNRFGNTANSAIMYFSNNDVVIENPLFEVEQSSTLENTMIHFHLKNKNRNQIHIDSVFKISNLLLNYLKTTYSKEIFDNENNPNNINLFFEENGTTLTSSNNIIYVGHRFVQNINSDFISKNEYEQKYINKYCKTKEDVFLFLFLVEFCTFMYKGRTSTVEYYQFVSNIVKQNRFIFSI